MYTQIQVKGFVLFLIKTPHSVHSDNSPDLVLNFLVLFICLEITVCHVELTMRTIFFGIRAHMNTCISAAFLEPLTFDDPTVSLGRLSHQNLTLPYGSLIHIIMFSILSSELLYWISLQQRHNHKGKGHVILVFINRSIVTRSREVTIVLSFGRQSKKDL